MFIAKMKKIDEDEILSEDFHRLHFIRVEQNLQNGSLKYHLKNHFNSLVMQVEGKYTETGNESLMELHFFVPKAGKSMSKDSSEKLYATIRKTSERQICDVTFPKGKKLARINALKDKSLSTYNYEVLDGDESPLFRIHQTRISVDRDEIAIKTLSSDHPVNLSELLIARINSSEGNAACLSMAPELDMITKARIIVFVVFIKVLETQTELSSLL